jgi:hypothetical protein
LLSCLTHFFGASWPRQTWFHDGLFPAENTYGAKYIFIATARYNSFDRIQVDMHVHLWKKMTKGRRPAPSC